MTAITLSEYWQRLREHDWTFNYSDDPSLYRAGLAEDRILREMRFQSGPHSALFNAFLAWGECGEPLPERPKMEDA